MSKHIKSETRTISNRGPFPRYIGYFPSLKVDGLYLPFDSISCLLLGIYLEWLKRIVKLSFEKYRHTLTVDGVTFDAIPDYTGTLDTGEEELAEAKYDRKALRPEEAEDLARNRRGFAEDGFRYEVYFRKELERDGFIQTIALLRRYARLPYSQSAVERTIRALQSFAPATLSIYRERALAAGLSTSLLYYVLYHQHLELKYEPFVHSELLLCRA